MFIKMLNYHEVGLLFITALTGMIIIYTLFARRIKKTTEQYINQDILQQRIAEFRPENVVNFTDHLETLTSSVYDSYDYMNSKLNLAKVNFLNILDDNDIKVSAAECIRSNGVGSCGPRGFFGTIDIHIELEDRLAKFMNLEEAVIYSYGFSTISSAIGAYCKRTDIIFCDEMISFSAKQGFLAAKSTIVYFKHNDMVDLEGKLLEYRKKETNAKKMFRKFLVVEGIYERTGTLCSLPELVKLRSTYQLRMFIDESLSFGVLGATGRGITEHYNVDRFDIDMIMGSLEGSMGSIGGFCVGASVIIEHQRLSGLGYCFSASLPPYLSKIAIKALDRFEEKPRMFEQLRHVSLAMHVSLHSIPNLVVSSDAVAPVKVFSTTVKTAERVRDYCAERQLYIVVQEDGTLRFYVNLKMTSADIDMIQKILYNAVNT